MPRSARSIEQNGPGSWRERSSIRKRPSADGMGPWSSTKNAPTLTTMGRGGRRAPPPLRERSSVGDERQGPLHVGRDRGATRRIGVAGDGRRHGRQVLTAEGRRPAHRRHHRHLADGCPSSPGKDSVPEMLLAPAIAKSAVNVAADLRACCRCPVQWPVKSYGAAASTPPARVASATATPSSVVFRIVLPSPPRCPLQWDETTLAMPVRGHRRGGTPSRPAHCTSPTARSARCP